MDSGCSATLDGEPEFIETKPDVDAFEDDEVSTGTFNFCFWLNFLIEHL